MSLARSAVLGLLFLLAIPINSFAVTPSEILSDPALEERARDISAELRCLVCQNQSIDDSDAELAKDLRVLVRERLVAGETNSEVIEYVVSRYGEFVLLKPRFSIRNLALWATPVLVFVIGGLIGLSYVRSSRQNPQSKALTADEELRLAKILDEGDGNRG